MRNRRRTDFVTECRTCDGADAVLRTRVSDDSVITLSGPLGVIMLSAEQVADLRNQLGEALTISLRDARTYGGRSA